MEPQNKEKPAEFDPYHFFESFIAVGKELILRPRFFFQQIPHTTNLKNPFLFLVICAFLSSLFMANLKKGDFNLFFILFTANTLSAFVGSFILHNFLAKIFGSKVLYAATFRIIAYASLMDIASWMPLVGPIAYIYGLYLIFIGLQEIHQLKPKQALTAVMTIFLVIFVLLIVMTALSPESLQEGMKILDPENSGF